MEYIGKPLPRREDFRLITGRGCFIDDLSFPNMLYAVFVRSPIAHGYIVRIDLSKAFDMGARAAFTGEELNKLVGSLKSDTIPKKHLSIKPMAEQKVRFVGEPLAVVLADNPYKAYDAANAVEVEYERLPAVTDPLAATEPGSPLVHDDFPNNICFTSRKEYGDVEEVFSSADRVIEAQFSIQRLIPSAMECRGMLALYDMSHDIMDIWATHQFPHDFRKWTSESLGIPESKIRVIVPDMGGAFGSKAEHYPEQVVIPYLAKVMKKPIKWIETRSENFKATTHGRGVFARLEAAVKNDGKFLGLKAKIISDLGAYPYFSTILVPEMIPTMLSGCYKIKAIEAEVTGVFTNKTPTAAYRGAGRPEASYFIERMMDRIARDLGIDPAEIRKRNFISPSEFPYKTVTGHVYDTGNYEAALNKALHIINYDQLRREQEELRKNGKLTGIGISCYVEVCNFMPQSAKVTVDSDGKVKIISGTMPHGQGEETAFAQIAADVLGVRLEDIDVIFGDTSLIPWGSGTAGSWTLTSGGNAILEACKKVRENILKHAAYMLEARPEDLEIKESRVYVKGVPDRAVSLREVAVKAYDPSSKRGDVEYGLTAIAGYNPQLTYPFGTHIAVVEIDQETGQVNVKRLVLVDDCGNVVNPLLVEGQIVGGAVQALGQALYEEVVYDSDGNLVTSSFADYLIPTAVEIPEIVTDRTYTPAPNPLGTKGVGEAATIGLTQAIVNAVEDALSPLGISIEKTPLHSSEIWSLLRNK